MTGHWGDMSPDSRGDRQGHPLIRVSCCPLSPLSGWRSLPAHSLTPPLGASAPSPTPLIGQILDMTDERLVNHGVLVYRCRLATASTRCTMENCAPALSPHSRRHRLAMLDGRTREARLLKAATDELTEHVGGNPSATQARQIARAARIELHMAMMDARSDQNGGVMTDHDSRQYLAWVNSYRLILRDLGLERRGPRQPTLAEALGQRPAA